MEASTIPYQAYSLNDIIQHLPATDIEYIGFWWKLLFPGAPPLVLFNVHSSKKMVSLAEMIDIFKGINRLNRWDIFHTYALISHIWNENAWALTYLPRSPHAQSFCPTVLLPWWTQTHTHTYMKKLKWNFAWWPWPLTYDLDLQSQPSLGQGQLPYQKSRSKVKRSGCESAHKQTHTHTHTHTERRLWFYDLDCWRGRQKWPDCCDR